jgi:replicative DNA helicase
MKSPDLFRIMLASESKITRTALRDGTFKQEDWREIDQTIKKIEELPIIWNDTASITTAQIKAATILNRRKGQCDMIVIDYLQLIKPFDRKAIREQQVAEISRTLKEIALSMNIPVICVSQLNREAEGGKPQLHHLRESGALEQDADVVLMPWRDGDDFKISIIKNRRGIIGTFPASTSDEMTVFADGEKLST